MAIIKEPTAVICLSKYTGGMEIDSINVTKKLSKYSKVILLAKKDSFIESLSSDYLGVDNISLETISFKSFFSFNIIFKVREIIKKNNIKNVIFFGASELRSLYFSFLGLDLNFIIRHGTTKTRPKKDWFHRLIYSNVNYHISNSRYLEENVKYIIPFGKKTKSQVIFTSFSLPKVIDTNSKKLTLVHVGRIAEGKGQYDAIKACQVFIDSDIDFEFNIVGGYDESYQDIFETFYNNCPYKNKINLIGFTKDVNSYLQKADIFLFPSHGEGFGNSFVEAMYFNNICISYNNTSFPYFKNMGFYFRMAKDKDYNNLSEILLDVAQNLPVEKEKSNINNNLVNTLFSLEKEINSYLSILK